MAIAVAFASCSKKSDTTTPTTTTTSTTMQTCILKDIKDSSGSLISSITYTGSHYSQIQVYNDNTGNAAQTYKFKYNSAGSIDQVDQFDLSNNQTQSFKYLYDANNGGRLAAIDRYEFSLSGTAVAKQEYQFKYENNLITHVLGANRPNQQFVQNEYWDYVYDTRGNITNITHYTGPTAVSANKDYTEVLTYDSMNNPLKNIAFNAIQPTNDRPELYPHIELWKSANNIRSRKTTYYDGTTNVNYFVVSKYNSNNLPDHSSGRFISSAPIRTVFLSFGYDCK